MKICASCGASLPDGAAFCIGCGSKEFTKPVMPDLDAPQEEKPKIEYDQYGRPIGQQYSQPEYEQPHFSESYEDPYQAQYSDQVDHPQYLEGYQQPMYEQPQQYQQPMYEQPQQYQQPMYEQPQQYQQPVYEQPQQQYQQPMYEQPQQYQQPVYEQPQQYRQPVYEQPQQYQQPVYEQPQQYQQPVYEQPQQYEQPVQEEPQRYTSPVIEPDPEPEPMPEPEKEELDPYQLAAEQKKTVDPHEAVKNFKFEKKDDADKAGEASEEEPKDLKGYIRKFRNTKDHTNEYDPYKFAESKGICKLAVLGPTFWLPFVVAKDSASAMFYANQGLLVFIVELILLIPELILTGIVGIGFSLGAQVIVGLVIDLILTVIIYAVPIFMISSAWKDIKEGRIKDVPFIGRFRILK